MSSEHYLFWMKKENSHLGYNIVWFKRDLRVQDHRVLASASAKGRVLPVYVVEPDLWRQPDMAGRHWEFIAESLGELQSDLAALGQPLVIRHGDMIEVLTAFHMEGGIEALWSHEETGSNWTYQRDLRVRAWCRAEGIRWHELRNHGVQRRLVSRNGWAKNWDQFMAERKTTAPAFEAITEQLQGYVYLSE